MTKVPNKSQLIPTKIRISKFYQLCKCGCGSPILPNPWNSKYISSYLYGHFKGGKQSEEHIRKRCESRNWNFEANRENFERFLNAA